MPDIETRYDLDAALSRLRADESLRIDLPGEGELYFARPVPFLTVYHYGSKNDRYTLHAEEAAYCIVDRDDDPELREFLKDILGYLADRFGGALVLDIRVHAGAHAPKVTVHAPAGHPGAVSEALISHLDGPTLDVELSEAEDRGERQDILRLDLDINGFFLSDDGRPFPLLLRNFREKLHAALRHTCFDFVRLETDYNATHFDQMGNHRVSDLVWEIDRKLVDISTSFRFLELVTATNDAEAFEQFKQNGYRGEPTFRYRFLPVDPEALVRDLFNLPIEKVRDATLAYILRDKRDETLRMLDMLANRGNEKFRHGSMLVFGGVDDKLLAIANSLLTIVPQPEAEEDADTLSAEEFLQACQKELTGFAEQYPAARPQAQIRDDLSGLMVSQGMFNIGHRLRVPRRRVEALIQHEIGTHVLTYWNGRAQPLTLLHSGTPGYEDLQEGLAVLSEWFVDGLTAPRLRILAARVVGIDNMLRGHGFDDTFHLLHDRHGIPERAAFYTTARIYRGGGFTKDAVYLRGLVELLDYLRQGGNLDLLFIGKLRLDYAPLLNELKERGILRPPPLIPTYFTEDRAAGHPKLNRLREGMTVFDLIPRR